MRLFMAVIIGVILMRKHGILEIALVSLATYIIISLVI